MSIAEHFRKQSPTGYLKPGLYVHVEGGLEIRIKALAQDRDGIWYAIVESRVTTGKRPKPWEEVKLYAQDGITYSFDYEPEA